MQKLVFRASLFFVVAWYQPAWASYGYACLGKFTVDAVKTYKEKEKAAGDKEVTVFDMSLKISNLKFAKLKRRNDLGQSGCVSISKTIETGIEAMLLREDPKALSGTTFYLFHFCQGGRESSPCEPSIISNTVFERWKRDKETTLALLADNAVWP